MDISKIFSIFVISKLKIEFEYRQIEAFNPMSSDYINGLGLRGWELVTVLNYKNEENGTNLMYIFKKEIHTD